MKKLITLGTVLAAGLSVFADDFNLYYDSQAGTANTKIEAVSNLQKLTFENGNMVAVMKDGTSTSLPMADIKRLFFASDTAVGIKEVKEETTAEKKGEVYDLTGRKLNINLESGQLPKGIYIIDGKKVFIQ